MGKSMVSWKFSLKPIHWMLYSNTSSSDGSGFFTLNIVKLSNLACVYLTSGKKNIINHQKPFINRQKPKKNGVYVFSNHQKSSHCAMASPAPSSKLRSHWDSCVGRGARSRSLGAMVNQRGSNLDFLWGNLQKPWFLPWKKNAFPLKCPIQFCE